MTARAEYFVGGVATTIFVFMTTFVLCEASRPTTTTYCPNPRILKDAQDRDGRPVIVYDCGNGKKIGLYQDEDGFLEGDLYDIHSHWFQVHTLEGDVKYWMDRANVSEDRLRQLGHEVEIP